VLQAISLGYVWYVQFRDREVAELAVGSAVTALGVGLAFSRPHLHPLLTHVVANMLIVGGQMLIAFAIGRFVDRRVPPWLVVAVPVAAGILIGVFTFIEPRFDVRVAAYSVSIAIASGITAALLIDVPRGAQRSTRWPLGCLYLVQSILAAGRAMWVFVGQPPEALFESARLQTVWFTHAFVLTNLILAGLVLMITQRPRLELNRQASFDALTGALNRRAFAEAGEIEWSRAARHDLPLSVLVLDLDGFKALNDTHGHDAGDAWLSAFGDLCLAVLRREDLFCRSGGEEFIALLPQTAVKDAALTAERLRQAVERLQVQHRAEDIGTTVSIGVATRGPSKTLATTIAAADRALYHAKAAGRNRVIVDAGARR
jgi:diguanylate cyclase (GGDEF)-like protein